MPGRASTRSRWGSAAAPAHEARRQVAPGREPRLLSLPLCRGPLGTGRSPRGTGREVEAESQTAPAGPKERPVHALNFSKFPPSLAHSPRLPCTSWGHFPKHCLHSDLRHGICFGGTQPVMSANGGVLLKSLNPDALRTVWGRGRAWKRRRQRAGVGPFSSKFLVRGLRPAVR